MTIEKLSKEDPTVKEEYVLKKIQSDPNTWHILKKGEEEESKGLLLTYVDDILVETTEELDARVAALYKQLSYPSAARFKAALAKRGIRVPDSFVQQLVKEQGSRQLFAPLPRFKGKVTAQHVDERWASDVVDFQSKTSAKGAPIYMLLVQDIFSRFLFAEALRSKAEVEAAFLRIMKRTNRKPVQLNTDSSSEYTNRSFQAMLEQKRNTARDKRRTTGPSDAGQSNRRVARCAQPPHA